MILALFLFVAVLVATALEQLVVAWL